MEGGGGDAGADSGAGPSSALAWMVSKVTTGSSTVASAAPAEASCIPAVRRSTALLNAAARARSEKEGNKASQVVLDTDGKVGKAYGAKTTPQLVVIDKEGKVAYNGAIDSKATTDVADVETADSYISAALDAVIGGKTVEKAKTQPYGCGVKYAK